MPFSSCRMIPPPMRFRDGQPNVRCAGAAGSRKPSNRTRVVADNVALPSDYGQKRPHICALRDAAKRLNSTNQYKTGRERTESSLSKLRRAPLLATSPDGLIACRRFSQDGRQDGEKIAIIPPDTRKIRQLL